MFTRYARVQVGIIALTAVLGFSTPIVSFAQKTASAKILGTVTDAETAIPLPGVHVFISRSMIGAVSDGDGHFELTIPLGAHRIVVSMIGYVTQTHDAMVRAARSYQFNIQLTEDVIALDEVIVSAERDEHWDKHLDRFLEHFIGETRNARFVELLNPEVLDFYESDGAFMAHTSEPLFLVNHALGYQIEHHLHQFRQKGDKTWQDGESYFSELIPETEEDSLRWEKNREMAFRGSSHHYFVSLVNRRTKNEGFLTYRVQDPRPPGETDPFASNQAAPFKKPEFAVNPAIYLASGKSGEEYVFAFKRYLEIVYTEEPEDGAYGKWQRIYHSGDARPYQYSWITLNNGPISVDSRGNVLDPYGVSYFGYMAFERIAELLPKEYSPKAL